MCHDWIWDGGQSEKPVGKKVRVIKTGYYRLREWPDGKPLFEQNQILIDIFHIIRVEETKLLSERIK